MILLSFVCKRERYVEKHGIILGWIWYVCHKDDGLCVHSWGAWLCTMFQRKMILFFVDGYLQGHVLSHMRVLRLWGSDKHVVYLPDKHVLYLAMAIGKRMLMMLATECSCCRTCTCMGGYVTYTFVWSVWRVAETMLHQWHHSSLQLANHVGQRNAVLFAPARWRWWPESTARTVWMHHNIATGKHRLLLSHRFETGLCRCCLVLSLSAKAGLEAVCTDILLHIWLD